ncbi:MAG TPA: hypothetical protein VF221_23510 [Chloroflexota bacterium]
MLFAGMSGLFLLGSTLAAGTPRYQYSPSTAKVAACAHAGKAIALPAEFPRAFPFPRGTVIDRTKPLLKGQIGIYGYVPSAGFASTVTFFRREVPRAGFKLLGFEVDAPNDSEGTYQGRGKIGRWQLRSLPACRAAMSFAASAEAVK